MVKVKIVATGEIKQVTRNEAHGLVDSGKAVLYHDTRMMTPSPEKTRGYKTK